MDGAKDYSDEETFYDCLEDNTSSQQTIPLSAQGNIPDSVVNDLNLAPEIIQQAVKADPAAAETQATGTTFDVSQEPVLKSSLGTTNACESQYADKSNELDSTSSNSMQNKDHFDVMSGEEKTAANLKTSEKEETRLTSHNANFEVNKASTLENSPSGPDLLTGDGEQLNSSGACNKATDKRSPVTEGSNPLENSEKQTKLDGGYFNADTLESSQGKESLKCGSKVIDDAQGQSPAEDNDSDSDESSADESSLTEAEIEDRRLEAKKLKDEGNVVYKNGDFTEAERLYTEGLKLCPKCLKKDRAVLYSNRSACLVKLDKSESAIEDCTKAVELHPVYLKAFLRRAQLYEKLEKYEEATKDYEEVLKLDPSVVSARTALASLPQKIEERNEKLKAQMMSSLKDLGNLFLRPFGLSTDNFQLQQDPNSGSYNIQFNNGPRPQNRPNNGPTNGPSNDR